MLKVRTDTNINLVMGYRPPVMVTNLVQLGMCLSFDQDVTYDLVKKSLNALQIRNVSLQNIDGYKVTNKKTDIVSFDESGYLFKRIIYFFKRDYVSNLKTSPANIFENLSWQERTMCTLKYVLDLTSDEIMDILDCSFKEFSRICSLLENRFITPDQIDLDARDLYQKSLEKYQRQKYDYQDDVYKSIKAMVPIYSFVSKDYIQLTKTLSRILSAND